MRALAALVVAILGLSACAPRRTTRPPKEPSPPVQAQPAQEGELQETPPLEQRSEPVIIFEEEPTPPPPPAQEEAPAPSAPSEVAGIPVFRVQVFAASSRERAEILAQELREIQQEPVVIVEEGGLYKVQVGAFSSRLLAEGYRDFLRTKGYPDAFIVQVKP